MPYSFLLLARDGPVERITLNRPEVRNAFNEHVIAELTHWAETVSTSEMSKRPRIVVLAGEGRAFCAGADVAWMAKTIDYTEEENVRDAKAMSRMFAAINAVPVPVVGRVHGAALGGGAGLAAVCDIVVAEERTWFGFTETRLGILPAVISPFALAKIGRSAARELFLTGSRFSAARAKEIGLVHAVVPMEQLDAAVDAYIRDLLEAGPESVAAAKALIQEVWGRPATDAQAITANAIATRRVSAEGQEGLRAFLAKRAASWTLPKEVPGRNAAEDKPNPHGKGNPS
jgi:methylglutaconyl-CoA hydratase